MCLCKHLKHMMNLMPRIFHFIPLTLFLRVAAVFHASKHTLKVRGLFYFVAVVLNLFLRLTCLTHALHPLPVYISDSVPGNSKAATRSCCSHHGGSTDTGHLAFSNPGWTVTFPKILVRTTVPRSVYSKQSGIIWGVHGAVLSFTDCHRVAHANTNTWHQAAETVKCCAAAAPPPPPPPPLQYVCPLSLL